MASSMSDSDTEDILDQDEKLEGDDGCESGDSDSSSGPPGAETCAICLGRIRGEVGSPEACDHIFCLICILEWAKTNATCPQDRKPFKTITVQECFEGPVVRDIPIKKEEEEKEQIPEENPTYCEVCHECDREERLLLCDGCDHGYHLECLDPPLDQVPVEEWFCPVCTTTPQTSTVEERRAETVSERPRERQRSTSTQRRNQRQSQGPRRIPRTQATERVRARIILRRRRARAAKRKGKRQRRRERIENGEEDDPRPTVKHVQRFSFFISGDADIDAEHAEDNYATQILSGQSSGQSSLSLYQDQADRRAAAARLLHHASFTPLPSYSGKAATSIIERVDTQDSQKDDVLSNILEDQSIALTSSRKLTLTTDRKFTMEGGVNAEQLVDSLGRESLLMSEPLPSQLPHSSGESEQDRHDRRDRYENRGRERGREDHGGRNWENRDRYWDNNRDDYRRTWRDGGDGRREERNREYGRRGERSEQDLRWDRDQRGYSSSFSAFNPAYPPPQVTHGRYGWGHETYKPWESQNLQANTLSPLEDKRRSPPRLSYQRSHPTSSSWRDNRDTGRDNRDTSRENRDTGRDTGRYQRNSPTRKHRKEPKDDQETFRHGESDRRGYRSSIRDRSPSGNRHDWTKSERERSPKHDWTKRERSPRSEWTKSDRERSPTRSKHDWTKSDRERSPSGNRSDWTKSDHTRLSTDYREKSPNRHNWTKSEYKGSADHRRNSDDSRTSRTETESRHSEKSHDRKRNGSKKRSYKSRSRSRSPRSIKSRSSSRSAGTPHSYFETTDTDQLDNIDKNTDRSSKYHSKDYDIDKNTGRLDRTSKYHSKDYDIDKNVDRTSKYHCKDYDIADKTDRASKYHSKDYNIDKSIDRTSKYHSKDYDTDKNTDRTSKHGKDYDTLPSYSKSETRDYESEHRKERKSSHYDERKSKEEGSSKKHSSSEVNYSSDLQDDNHTKRNKKKREIIELSDDEDAAYSHSSSKDEPQRDGERSERKSSKRKKSKSKNRLNTLFGDEEDNSYKEKRLDIVSEDSNGVDIYSTKNSKTPEDSYKVSASPVQPVSVTLPEITQHLDLDSEYSIATATTMDGNSGTKMTLDFPDTDNLSGLKDREVTDQKATDSKDQYSYSTDPYHLVKSKRKDVKEESKDRELTDQKATDSKDQHGYTTDPYHLVKSKRKDLNEEPKDRELTDQKATDSKDPYGLTDQSATDSEDLYSFTTDPYHLVKTNREDLKDEPIEVKPDASLDANPDDDDSKPPIVYDDKITSFASDWMNDHLNKNWLQHTLDIIKNYKESRERKNSTGDQNVEESHTTEKKEHKKSQHKKSPGILDLDQYGEGSGISQQTKEYLSHYDSDPDISTPLKRVGNKLSDIDLFGDIEDSSEADPKNKNKSKKATHEGKTKTKTDRHTEERKSKSSHKSKKVESDSKRKKRGESGSRSDQDISKSSSPQSTDPTQAKDKKKDERRKGGKDKSSSKVQKLNPQQMQMKAVLEAKVVTEVKHWLDPYYQDKSITREEYKEIVAKCVTKVVSAECGDIIESEKMRGLVEGYVKLYKHRRSKQQNCTSQ